MPEKQQQYALLSYASKEDTASRSLFFVLLNRYLIIIFVQLVQQNISRLYIYAFYLGTPHEIVFVFRIL